MPLAPCPPLPHHFCDAESIRFSGLQVVKRQDLVGELVADSRVLHFGCCDHPPLIETKMRSGDWLHDTVLAHARTAVGIDINEEALQVCRRLRPQEDFLAWDLLEDPVPTSVSESSWDWCLLPETLEHLGNPVDFLTQLHSRLDGHCERLLVTVPNATLLGNFVSALRGREVINTDHRHWYTPFTLMKVLTDAGFIDLHIATLEYARVPGLKGVVKRRAQNAFPLLASGIAMTASW